MGQAENNITKKIKDYLKSLHIWHVKFFANGLTAVGIPDILACIKGKFVGIEVKAEHGVVSKIQEYQGRKIRESGGKWLVVRPSTFEQFKEFVKQVMEE